MTTMIEIVETDTNEVVRTIDVSHLGERGRERCERGVNINLDHSRFHTRVNEHATTEDAGNV